MSLTQITPNGKLKLEARLKQLREVERPQNVADIEEARAHGDLRENAEYHAAKERQSMISAQIQMLESTLAQAEVVDPATFTGTRIMWGATVTVVDSDTDRTFKYQIVGDAEADSALGQISIKAPTARGLIGKTEGDEAEIHTPAGIKSLYIEKVEYV